MSFLLPLALLLGLTAIIPVIAHALRRGQARPLPFPATRFVPARSSSAKERNRVEDRFLLALRALLLLCLALLAASPFVQCSRLSLARTNGASLAAVLIIDDSGSMRARGKGDASRLELAQKAAAELVAAAQPGDSFAIVLAGRPARVLSPPTSELGVVRSLLDTIQPSDRESDLSDALSLARSLVADAPQKDRPLVLFSDLAIEAPESLELEGVIIPDAGLRDAFQNCALMSALRTADSVQVEVACTSSDALEGRSIELLDEKGGSFAAPVPAQDGAVRIALGKDSQAGTKSWLNVRLTPPRTPGLDAIEADDDCAVLETAAGLTLAVRADQSKAGLKTGSGTVVQAGLEALERRLRVETISLLPDQKSELSPFAGILIDDPSGFTPEISEALLAWVNEGGVGLLFLGPGIKRTPLGSNYSPFLTVAPTWVRSERTKESEQIAGSLGPLTPTWSQLGAREHAFLSDAPDLEVKASWQDGTPLVVERLVGRGLLLTVTVPASVDESDLALRPAFLELLDYVASQAALRRGAQASLVGESWRFPNGSRVAFAETPDEALETSSQENGSSVQVSPPVAGRYLVNSNGEESVRIAMRHAAEQIRQPQAVSSPKTSSQKETTLSEVGISREIALLALLLSALELGFRVFRRSRGGIGLPQSA